MCGLKMFLPKIDEKSAPIDVNNITERSRIKLRIGPVDDNEQDVIILGELTIEQKKDVPENDDVLLHIENDPLATEDQGNENTRQNTAENIIENLDHDDVHSDNAKVEPNKVIDLNKLDTGQNQNNDQQFGQKITENIENVSCGPKKKKDNKATEQEIEVAESFCDQNKVGILKKIFQTRFRLEKKTEAKKVVDKQEISSHVSLKNILDTWRATRKKYDLQLEVPNYDDIYNDDDTDKEIGPIRHRRHSVFEKAIPKTDFEGNDKVLKRRKSMDCSHMKKREKNIRTKQYYNDDDDVDTVNKKKICDSNFGRPRLNEKETRHIGRRRHSVFEKAIPKTDSEGSNKASKRRKSMDCSQMKNRDNKIGTKQNYNDDGDEDNYTVSNKNICDINLGIPPLTEQGSRTIKRRRHSVFDKAKVRSDSEGGDKKSKRRKSVDCSRMKNGDNVFGTKHNYNDDGDKDNCTVPNKKICEINLGVPHLNEKGSRTISQRRHSVFDKAKLKSDSEGGDKKSKRRKSVDCSRMKNGDSNTGTKQNYNDDGNEDTVTNKKICDINPELPPLNEKGSRTIKQRRHSVFDKGKLRSDSKGNKNSKRRKSMDCSQIKNGNNKIDTEQNYNDDDDEDVSTVPNKKICYNNLGLPLLNEKGNRPIRKRRHSVFDKAKLKSDSEGGDKKSKRRKSVDCRQIKNGDNEIDIEHNYNDDDDANISTVSNEKICDNNLGPPLQNEKEGRPIRQRRQSVFDKAKLKSDSEDGVKKSKRRKSVDCSHMKNGEDKIDTQENYNDHDDENSSTVPSKKFCDINFKLPRLNEKGKNRPVTQRRHSVFEKAIPKTDSEGGDKKSKRRKSVDCSQIKNKVIKIVTEQNYEESDDKLDTSKCHSSSRVNEAIKARGSEKTTDVDTSAQQDPNIVNENWLKQKYKDYDLFKGPLKRQRNFREEREADLHLMKHREAALNCIRNRRAVVNIVKMQDIESSLVRRQEPERCDTKKGENERVKSNASALAKSITSDPSNQSPSQNNSKQSEESGTKDINIGNNDGDSQTTNVGKKVKKKVSFHPDIVTRSQHRKNIAKDQPKHSDTDDTHKKELRENKSIDDHGSKSFRANKQKKADEIQDKGSREKNGVDHVSKSSRENKQNKSSDYPNKVSRENCGTGYQRRSSREKNKQNETDNNQNKGSKEDKQRNDNDRKSKENKNVTDHQRKSSTKNILKKDGNNPDKRSRDNESLTDYQSKNSRENKQNETDYKPKESSKNKNTTDYRSKRSREDKVNKPDHNQNKGLDQNKADHKSQNHLDKRSGLDTNLEPAENLNRNIDKKSEHIKASNVPENKRRRKLLDDLKIKESGKKKNGFNNEEHIQLQCMEKDHTVTSLSHKRTSSDDLTYERSFDVVNERDNKIVEEHSDVDNITPKRSVLEIETLKYKYKLRGGIFVEPFSVVGKTDGDENIDSSKEKQCKDITDDQFRSKTDEILQYKGLRLDKEKDCTVDEMLYQKRKYSDSNTFKDQGRDEKSSKHSDDKGHKRVSIDNKDPGCELFDEPINKNLKEKKTDSDKQKNEGVNSKSSEDKPKRTQRSVNDKHSKHRRDESSDKKCSDRKSSRNKNKSFDEIKDNNSDNKDRVDRDFEGEKKDSSHVSKHRIVKDKDNRKAGKRNRSEVNTVDKIKQNSSDANNDGPTSAIRTKADKDKNTRSSSESLFADLLEDDTGNMSEEESFRAKILEARALESEDEADKLNKRLTTSGRKPQLEFHKHIENIKTIMRWTNATPIRNFASVGYECAFCNLVYHKPGDLKTHTLESHHSFSSAYFAKKADMTTYLVKLDITDFECYICTKKMEDVKAAMNHLSIDHKKKIHGDIKDHIVPFKFDYNDTVTLTCFMCTSRYTKFKMLLEHTISTHFRNYTCKECNMGFVNTRKLQFHLKIHNKCFKCDYCDKTHDTLAKKIAHENIHQVNASPCAHCGELFFDDTKKLRHLVEIHGVGLPGVTCSACNRVFAKQADCINHMKLDHTERKYECTQCPMTFFKNAALKYHMLKHTSDICYQMLSRKETVTQHTQGQDDKRFACERCGRRFMTKSSWRKHMIEVHHENI